ncbi:MAG: DNA alkylation repair protein, partial [Chloroflexota bacterium]
VSPGCSNALAVRAPLVAAIQRPLRKALEETSSALALYLGQALANADEREMRLFAMPFLERSLGDDPERTWQLLRQMGARAGDWIEVDTLAGVWAQGVLAEPFRRAELDQLVYSGLAMERRLVGATLATLPHRVPKSRRVALRGTASSHAFELLRQLIGDASPMVQKALSWAIREWSRVDADGATALLREQTAIAVEQHDGNRAWVVRDALSSAPPELGAELRSHLVGVRRDHHAISTSIAAGQTAAFASAVRAHGPAGQQGDRYARSRP